MDNERDIPMSIKMNNKCFPGIGELARGETIEEAQILEILDFIDRRLDCADFRMVCILRSLHDFSSLVSETTLERMKATVLSFKYWMDEPGEDSMCYWSENHQLLFAACEYLAGQRYPDAVFTNDGQTGRNHQKKAEKRLMQWFDLRFHLGFVEWHSNTYYEEDIAPLSLLVDCCHDEEIVQKATMLLDLLLLDMALHSYEGYFSASSGRCYEKQKQDPAQQDTLDIASKAFGVERPEGYDYTRLSADFLLNRGYQVPPVIRSIANAKETLEVRTSMGLKLDEVGERFPFSKDMDGRGMYMWSMEAFTNPESVCLTLRIFNAWKLKTNDFLKNIASMNMPVLKQLGLMPMMIRLLNPVTQGIAIQRANTYTYRTREYMLSTAQQYHPGAFGDQQHIWQASLPGGVSVFTTHPGAAFFEDNARNFSPSYWVGNGIQPHAAQHQNVVLCLYDLRVRKGLLEKKRQQFTHAWFPKERFDETVLEKRLAAGKKGDSYAALLATGDLTRHEESELIQQGMQTGWTAVLGSREEYGGFDAFVQAVREAALVLTRRGLKFSMGAHTYEIIYQKTFLLDGEPQNVDYQRLECAYASVPRNPERYDIQCKGHSLTLDWANLSRTCQ